MEPLRYAGLLRPRGSAPAAAGPPRYDPGYPASAEVVGRDLGIYTTLVGEVTP
jgi:hypothetical protein